MHDTIGDRVPGGGPAGTGIHWRDVLAGLAPIEVNSPPAYTVWPDTANACTVPLVKGEQRGELRSHTQQPNRTEAGDHAGYLDRVARHVRGLADDVDVVVLAQASMAPAANLVGDLSIPVRSSPRLAVLRAVELADA